MSSCWTMSPNVRRQRAEAVGLEPTSGMFPPPVFKTGSSSGRMTSVICKLRELESNQRLRVQSPASLPAATIPQWYASNDTSSSEKFTNCGGRNRTCGLVVQSHGFLPAETTPQWESALRESNPPVQGGSLVPLPLGQGHVFFVKAEAVGLEPTIPILGTPAFEAGSSSSRMTSIRQAAATGIEPVS
jgi:hypothetical protein